MEALFTNVAPLRAPEAETIKYNIEKCISDSDKLEIAVGYFSTQGLDKLNEWVHKYNIKDVTLIGGMYSVEGIPESVYNKMVDIEQIWSKEQIGQILLVNNMNYHGKIYTFWKNGQIIKTVLGSANLGAICPSTSTQRQYELATIIEDKKENLEYQKHLEDLKRFTTTVEEAGKSFKKIHEKIALLDGIEGVSTLTDTSIKKVQDSLRDDVLRIPIKAPKYADRFNSDRGSFSHSNINVCYAKGRLNSKTHKRDPRKWFEVQITCDVDLIDRDCYPRKAPFFIITDDNYMFEAHTTSDNHKQLSAYGSDRVIGRWIKGRLVAMGLLKAYDNVNHDKNRDGMVTIEMLNRAHMRVLELHKTNLKYLGKVYSLNSRGRLDKKKAPKYKALDVWYATFSNNLENK